MPHDFPRTPDLDWVPLFTHDCESGIRISVGVRGRHHSIQIGRYKEDAQPNGILKFFYVQGEKEHEELKNALDLVMEKIREHEKQYDLHKETLRLQREEKSSNYVPKKPQVGLSGLAAQDAAKHGETALAEYVARNKDSSKQKNDNSRSERDRQIREKLKGKK